MTVALIFGGMSPEHEISLRSAKNIYSAIDKQKYRVILIGISQGGSWHEIDEQDFAQLKALPADNGYPRLLLLPGKPGGVFIRQEDVSSLPNIDVAFPIIHGTNGEDGTLQGLLRQMEIPFVGPDVCGSAISMDKDVAKRLLLQADLLTAAFLSFQYGEKDAIDPIAVFNQLGSPLFVKPARMGSSVGVSKAETPAQLQQAITLAFEYDSKILIEEAVNGRELECAVMGNEMIEATSVGEVIMNNGFYDYEAKYISEDAAEIVIPARDIDDQLLAKLILVAKSAYQALECEGMARVDMFLQEDDSIYINEVNTLPGFTSSSMYPKLWEHAGTSYTELIDHLLELALERSKRDGGLKCTRA